jgi:hypothetical protein
LDWLKQLDPTFSRNRIEEEGDWFLERAEEEDEDDGDYFTQALDRVDLYLEHRQVPRGYIL